MSRIPLCRASADLAYLISNGIYRSRLPLEFFNSLLSPRGRAVLICRENIRAVVASGFDGPAAAGLGCTTFFGNDKNAKTWISFTNT